MKGRLILAILATAGTLAALTPPVGAETASGEAAGAGQMSPEMQQAFEKMGKIGENHELLGKLVGEWDSQVTMQMTPESPPEKTTGKAVTESLMDGRFIKSTYTSTMMGRPFSGMSITGYDNVQEKFVNTWLDNFGTGILLSSGSYDPDSKTFTYQADMDDCMQPGKRVKIKEVIKVVDDDKHIFEFYETREGKETRTMEIVYTRAGKS